MIVHFKLLRPHEAPAGTARAMNLITGCLEDPAVRRARFAVAFARKAGVVRIVDAVRQLRDRGGRAEAIVGVDHQGTSEEALRLLLEWFDEVTILHEPGSSVTFHPKMYLFDGDTSGRALVGSHNLTLGGLELNYEAGIVLKFSLPEEASDWSQFDDAWSAMLPTASPAGARLTDDLIDRLSQSGLVQPERAVQERSWTQRDQAARNEAEGPGLPFRATTITPQSVIANVIPIGPRARRLGRMTQIATASVLIIEVVPHTNSEIFLSSTAIQQNPIFFGWPWSGLTTPKLATNKGYPKMDPNPTVRVIAHDQDGTISETSTIRPEVMRYHNADVRMTVGTGLLPYIPAYSLLVIRHADDGVGPGIDYEIEVHPDGSPGHQRWIDRCDQTLPSGGNARARRMGWA